MKKKGRSKKIKTKTPPTFDNVIKSIDEQQQTIPEYQIWWYYDKGFSIIPLGKNKDLKWNKTHKDELKKPSLNSWDKYKDTRATKEEIQTWIDQGLFKNIGVIGGHVSNDLVIIDIDDETIPETIGINFDSIIASGSWVVKTGKGYHIYCKHNSNPGGIQKPLKYKIEYRANRGYVVAPPSTHPDGNKYSFMNVNNFDELPELVIKDVKLIFKDFKNKIGKAWNIKPQKPIAQGAPGNNEEEQRGYPKCVEIALNTITKPPMRYYTIYGIASSFVWNNIPVEMAMARIKRFNLEKCVPPHENSIIEQAVNGAYKPDAKLYGCEFWIDDAEMCPYEDITKCPYGNKRTKQQLLGKYKVYEVKEDKNGNIVRTGKINCPRLGELIYNEFDYNFKTVTDTMEIYYYEDGVYHGGGEKLIAGLAEEYLETDTKGYFKNEVIGYIRDKLKSFIERRDFVSPPHLINCNNGIYNIDTNKFISHTPKYFFLNKIPVNYDADAKSKEFETFIQQILSKEKERRKKLEDTIQEHIGYGLYNKFNIDNFIVIDGGGRNGKTTLFETLETFYGSNNICAVTLQDLNNRPFTLHKLYGKMANISDDLPPKAVNDTGVIKKITGGSPLWADVKHSIDGIRFTNTSKQWFGCNQLPSVSDMSDAFYGRMMHITFLNRYLKDKEEIDDKHSFKQDGDLADKLATDENLSAMLNYAIEGLRRLLKNKDFSYPTSVDERRDIYLKKSNPLFAFIEEECEMGDQDWCITVANLHKAVNTYCDGNGFNRISSVHALTKGLNDMGRGLILTRKIVNGERQRVWEGLRSLTDTTINHYVGKDQEMQRTLEGSQ